MNPAIALPLAFWTPLGGARPALTIAEPLPELPLQLTVEPLGLLFALLASLLWIVTSVYSIGYTRARRETNLTRFYTCFALSFAQLLAPGHGHG